MRRGFHLHNFFNSEQEENCSGGDIDLNQQSLEQEEHDQQISESELWDLNEHQLVSDKEMDEINGLDQLVEEEYMPRIPMRRQQSSLGNLVAITINEVQLQNIPTTPLLLRRQNAITPVYVSPKTPNCNMQIKPFYVKLECFLTNDLV